MSALTQDERDVLDDYAAGFRHHTTTQEAIRAALSVIDAQAAELATTRGERDKSQAAVIDALLVCADYLNRAEAAEAALREYVEHEEQGLMEPDHASDRLIRARAALKEHGT